MSIQSEIERINNNVQDSLSICAENGVEVEENANSDALPAAVAALAANAGSGSGNITFATEEPTESDGAEGELRLVYPDDEAQEIVYTQVEYIQSDGSQYINTGFTPDNNTKVIADVQFLATPTDHAAVFGARSSNTLQYWLYYSYSSKAYAYRYGATNTNYTVKLDATTRATVTTDANVLTVNGTTATATAATFTAPCNMTLFAINNEGSLQYQNSLRMYSCQIYDNGTLVRDFVPCINDVGVAGLYDKVNGVFYADAAGGTFTAGAVVGEIAISAEESNSGEGYFKINGKWYKLRPQVHKINVGTSWASDSSGYYQTIAVDGISADDTPTADVVLGTDVAANALYKAAWALVDRIVTAANSITLYANTSAPTTAFTIQLKT